MFSLLALLFLYFYISTNKWIYLILSSIALGLTIATRYVGISLIPPVVISIFILARKPTNKKLLDLITLITLAALPISLWIVRNLLIAQSAANRSVVFHPISLKKLGNGVFTFYSLFIPSVSSIWIGAADILIFIFLISLIIYALYQKRGYLSQTQITDLIFVLIGFLFVISHFVVLILSISFVDTATSLNTRLLLPAFIIFVISLFSLVFTFSSISARKSIWLNFIACVVVLIRVNIPSTIDRSTDFHINGKGYNAIIWDESSTLIILESIHPDVQIFSNASDVIRYRLGLDAITLPPHTSATSLVENENYSSEISSMCDTITDGKALVVYLDELTRWHLPTEDELLKICELPILYDAEDGTKYGLHE